MSVVRAFELCPQDQSLKKVMIKTIKMPKEFTVVEAVPYRDEFKSFCDKPEHSRPDKIDVDFSHTSFIDSSGVGALVSMIKLARKAEVQLSIVGLTPQVRATLTMTGLDQLIRLDCEATTENLSSNDMSASVPVSHASVRSSIKRGVDIVGALAGLTITAMLFPLIALAIRLDGRGPLLFSQTRCGWMGKPFTLYKFRSMVPDAEARKHEIKNEAQGAIFKADHDPRITRIGRFLRRTSLDELPQFWNVLTGSMSLVGTRPPTPDEIDQYDVPEWRRLDVKPGITGEWQVNGRSAIKDFADIIRLDLRYQRNWSLLYDIKLMFKTITVIFSKRSGAV